MNEIDTSNITELRDKVREKLDSTQLFKFKGTVSKLLGLTVEVKLPGLKIGDLCYIETSDGRKNPLKFRLLKVMLLSFCFYMTERE